MRKLELVNEVAKLSRVNSTIVSKVLECTLGVIKNEISLGNKVSLSNFGTFSTKVRAKKIGRDITRNKEMVVPAHKIPVFIPSNKLKNKIKLMKVI